MILSFVLFYLQIGFTENLLVVWRDSLRETNYVGSSVEVAAVLAVALTLNLINFGLAAVFRNRQPFLAAVFVGGTAFLNLLILIYVSVIVSIN